MKKLFTFVSVMLVGASLSFAQAAQSTPAPSTGTAASGDTAKPPSKHHHHHHKGGKKMKKSGEATSAPSSSPAPK